MTRFFWAQIFFFLGVVLQIGLWGDIPLNSLRIMPPMDRIYHPVSTMDPEAQYNFDRGLTFIFAFNHDLALHYFKKASELDPNLAMAYWGMALAVGQNVNEDVTPERELKGYHYIQQALKLAPKASKNEQAYISALAKRYTNDPTADLIPLRQRYREAMKQVVQTYPEDLDAATLYAESILDLDPWKWWTPDGKPKEGIYEAIDVLEFVLKRNPEHIGANHFYIHAWEESPYPERALMSAHRLETLLPESGHLLHMPCHIFILLGDYINALRTNQKAIAADREYLRRVGLSLGTYPLHYLSHNLYILARIYMLMEDYDKTVKAAFELTHFVESHLDDMPHLDLFFRVPLEIYLYFGKWKEILEYDPPTKNPIVQAYRHFSRGVAFIALDDLDSAYHEKERMQQFKQKIKPEDQLANNPASKVLELAETLLNAAFAFNQKNKTLYLDYLNQAIEIQDHLNYDEPPACPIPLRQLLGFALLHEGRYAEAEEAFRKALNKLQRNGRILFGLFLSLKGQGRTLDAYWVEREMKAALEPEILNRFLKHASFPFSPESS